MNLLKVIFWERAFLLSGSILVLNYSAAGQAVVFHDGFESPQLAADSNSSSYLDGTDFGLTPNWTSQNSAPPSGGIELINGNRLSTWGVVAQEGQQFLALNASNRQPTVSIYHTIDTTIGETYQVSYQVGRGGGGGGTVGLRVEVSDVNGTVAQLDTDVASVGWLSRSLSFVAGSTSSKLTFVDTSHDTFSVDVLLDSVTVSVVPEPSTSVISFAFGLCAFGMIRKWRNR